MTLNENNATKCDICIIEPFYGGSHKQLSDLIQSELQLLNIKYDLYSLPAKKWPWRARCSALYFSQIIKRDHQYKILLVNSVLNLSDLIALRKDLANTEKIVYFHENQLVYPVRNKDNQERDFQFGYNQILTSLVADKVIFNSNYNKNSFLSTINTFLKMIPDNRPKIDIKNELEPKCDVLYFPINIDISTIDSVIVKNHMDDLLNHLDLNKYLNRPLHICWPHRWEHDKNPESFFDTLFKLNDLNADFRLSVLGESFTEKPEIFSMAKEKLQSKIVNWGYLPSKEEYYNVLSKCDIVVSTSLHEFFGVSVLEACLFGCYPLLPNRLSYPELYPQECLYSTEAQLLKKLKYFCMKPSFIRKINPQNNVYTKLNRNFLEKFLWKSLKSKYLSLLRIK